MSTLLSLFLAVVGTAAAVAGGFMLGRRKAKEVPPPHLEATLGRVLQHLENGTESVARMVDPLAGGGRNALHAILDRIKSHGGFVAVTLSDDAGLILAGVGISNRIELMAVTAAAHGSTADRVATRHRALLEAHADSRWTVHRYFQVDREPLCLSATRQGGIPRVDALDGAIGALEQVLGPSAVPSHLMSG